MATNQKKSVTLINILIIILIFGAIAAVSVYFLTSPTNDYLQGQAEFPLSGAEGMSVPAIRKTALQKGIESIIVE